MDELTATVREMPECLGAIATGVVTVDMLEGGPPSADLAYVLPTAKSALCFALPLDQHAIELYLRKEDHDSYDLDNVRTNTLASGIALEVASFIEQQGFASVPLAANLVYRADTKHGRYDEKPPVSHRYLAVRSGIGHFGWSGNVIHKKEGAAIILGAVVTEAELAPTDPLPEEENYCDKCGICVASCASGFMLSKGETTVTLGGLDFSYCKRRHHVRCDYVCGGFTGLHRSGEWSTWSPARFPIPEEDQDFRTALTNAAQAYVQRPRPTGGFFHALMPGYRLESTCGNCQLVCHPEREVREQRLKMVTESGVIVQNPNGTREAVSPEEAKERLAAMSPEVRAMYENLE